MPDQIEKLKLEYFTSTIFGRTCEMIAIILLSAYVKISGSLGITVTLE